MMAMPIDAQQLMQPETWQNGDYILAILAKEWKVQTVVGTVMTNLGFIKAMTETGIAFEKTPVGDRYVLENMLANGHKLGGEQSGHIIMRDFD